MSAASFSVLYARARHKRTVPFINSEILFCSTSGELVDFAVNELLPLLPLASEQQKMAKRFTVVLENTASVLQNSPDVFAWCKVVAGKRLQSLELGDAVRYHRHGGEIVIEIVHIGIFHHDGQGNFVLLVDSTCLALAEGHRLNIQGLLNLLISEVLLQNGRCLAHAGGSGRFGRCQLWTGNSGAGKTTRTLQQVSRGEDFYGDDQVIIGRQDDGFWYVWPFWRAVKVTQESWRRLDGLPFLQASCPETAAKQVMGNVGEDLAVVKPACGRIIAINLLVPDDKRVLRQLSLEEAFQLVAPCFLHTLLPMNGLEAMGSVLDLLSEVEVRAVSWDMLKELDELEAESRLVDERQG